MASPYQMRLQFYLEGTEDEIFHELKGTEYKVSEGDIIYLNDVKYRVESVELYIYDNNYTNPTSNVDQWSMNEELYKVYMSLV